MKFLYKISRIILGLVFIVSGFLKAVDPLGTTFKLSDYFVHVFGLGEMFSFALILSFLLNAIEFSLGVMLLFNLFPKLSSWLFWALMAIFTPLTLYLAIKNPITDCGCFGDAIKLSNWQTFWKNIIFIILFLPFQFMKNRFPPRFSLKCRKFILTVTVLLIFSFELYNYNYLPIIDFRPYKVGVNIPEAMAIPADAPKDEYQTILIYKNKRTGEVREFTEENYPWQDTNWMWLDTKTKLIKKGYQPPIHDFAIVDSSGNDITDSVLHLPYAILIITYDITKANIRGIRKIKNLIPRLASNLHASVFWLSGSSDKENQKIKTKFDLHFSFFSTDQTALKTFIRANPGIVILKNGTIYKKFHYHTLNKHIISKIN